MKLKTVDDQVWYQVYDRVQSNTLTTATFTVGGQVTGTTSSALGNVADLVDILIEALCDET